MQRTTVEMIKIVETTARDAITIKHFFATPMDEQVWTSGFCVVSCTLFAVVAWGILVFTGNNPPCVAFVVTFISAVVVGVLKNVVLIGDSVVVEKFLAFSVVLVWR